jgi:hypothetical protein
MQEFWLYFDIGRKHIADLEGYDHILFVAALCLRYTYKDWKKLLILITAFTIGHSITLALSTLNFVNVSTKWVEFLIPVTIMLTAVANVYQKEVANQPKFPLIYFFTLFFGLIHGLGFSNVLKSMLGRDHNIVPQLLAFNLGLELGQLLIVAAVLIFTFIVVGLIKLNKRIYISLVSSAIFIMALWMAIERWPLKEEEEEDDVKIKKTELPMVINHQKNSTTYLLS